MGTGWQSKQSKWNRMPPELKNKEEVALVATAKDWRVWGGLSPDMQENEKILMGIIRLHAIVEKSPLPPTDKERDKLRARDVLKKNPKAQEIMTKITDLAREFGCQEAAAARAMVEPVVVQLSAIDNNSPCV